MDFPAHDRVIQIDTGYALAAVMVDGDSVVFAAPIFRWMVGKKWSECRKWSKIKFMTEYDLREVPVTRTEIGPGQAAERSL